jgi:hypothetical protein
MQNMFRIMDQLGTEWTDNNASRQIAKNLSEAETPTDRYHDNRCQQINDRLLQQVQVFSKCT